MEQESEFKKIILIGRSTAGKTSLCQAIRGEELNYYKTQTVHIENSNMIDTPGEYIERTYLKGCLVVSAADAEVIVLVQDPTKDELIFPPTYGAMFNKPCIGIITKIDIAEEKQIEHAHKYLEIAGAQKILKISNKTKEGIKEFLDLIKK